MKNGNLRRCLSGLLLSSVTCAIAALPPRPGNWAVTIVMPPKIVAGQLATLATLGLDGTLAPHITVDFGDGNRAETDTTGRAVFTVPKTGNILIVHASGDSVAALVDSAEPKGAPSSISVAPIVSVRDRFSICGAGFQGDAEQNRVQINDAFALVLASSPECLVVIAPPKTSPGLAKVSAKTSSGFEDAATSLVAFTFDPPQPPLTQGVNSWLTLRATGSDRRLSVLVKNEAPGVIHFDKGDEQEVLTSGGPENAAQIRVAAVNPGDFSFHAQLLPPPNVELSHRFLEAAQLLAPPEMQHNVKKLANDLTRHPRDAEKVRSQLQQMISIAAQGDFRTVLQAAYSAL